MSAHLKNFSLQRTPALFVPMLWPKHALCIEFGWFITYVIREPHDILLIQQWTSIAWTAVFAMRMRTMLVIMFETTCARWNTLATGFHAAQWVSDVVSRVRSHVSWVIRQYLIVLSQYYKTIATVWICLYETNTHIRTYTNKASI